jgi:hypothetical protein
MAESLLASGVSEPAHLNERSGGDRNRINDCIVCSANFRGR